MTHQRERIVTSEIVRALSYSPCVGLVGMRQVGKSTLLKRFVATYYSFDDTPFLRRFERETTSVLESAPPVALDEIQKHPPAFDALKFNIDEKKRMGRFMVSGSVRFASRRQIRESLTGRIVVLEIFPLGLAECHEKKAGFFLSEALEGRIETVLSKLEKKSWATPTQISHYLTTGGLPGICFRRDEKVRAELFEQHLDALLSRDIHLVRQTRLSFAQLQALLTAVASQAGLPINISHLARLCGCSVPTVKSSLQAMEGLFLIRSYGKTWVIEDAGLSHHLAPLSHRLTNLWKATYHELRLQYYRSLRNQAAMRPHTTRGGIDVPFFFEFKKGQRLAVMLDAGDWPSEKSLKSVTWLQKRYSNLRAFILTGGTEVRQVSDSCAAIPQSWIY